MPLPEALNAWIEPDSFTIRRAPFWRCGRAGSRSFAWRRQLLTATLISARGRVLGFTCCVVGNPSTLVLPSFKHSLLQTLSSVRVRHRYVLLVLRSISNLSGLPMTSGQFAAFPVRLASSILSPHPFSYNPCGTHESVCATRNYLPSYCHEAGSQS